MLIIPSKTCNLLNFLGFAKTEDFGLRIVPLLTFCRTGYKNTRPTLAVRLDDNSET